MRKSRRLVVAAAVSALVAGGGIGVGWSLVAHANILVGCDSTTTAPITCTLPNSTNTDTTINTPSAVQAVITLNSGDGSSPSDQYVAVTYQLYCSEGGADATTTQATAPALPAYQSITKGTALTDNLVLGESAPDSCTVQSLIATLYVNTGTSTTPVYSSATTGSFTMDIDYTPATSASSTASASSSSSSSSSSVNVTVAKGYGGKCLDDRGNSSANRAAVIIWSCNTHDRAQGFTFSGGHLRHNGKCVNDAGNGGSGTHMILWTCNGASNEKWFHSTSDGEFVLSSTSHGFMCLTDPGSSTTNGTQLTVSKCTNKSNQHWT